MIAVIDYGMGNLRSVQKALEVSGARTVVTSEARDIEKADKLVFPGVGAFGEAMNELKRRGLIDPIKDAIRDGKIFLGLCLGLQLLFEDSEEDPGVKGLSIFKGEVRRFAFAGKNKGLKVPHMGWNSITQYPTPDTRHPNPNTQYPIPDTRHPNPNTRTPNPDTRYPRILKGVPDGSYMYFVHSYYVKPKDRSIALTTTGYGIDFVSGIHKDNVYAFQFHPEKSQELGLKILRNFVRLKR